MSIKYRPEIDGLRAIAVMAVIFYHVKFVFLGAPFLSGGFLGVDIFFVISGYLIASIILREMKEDTFSFARFYERRARRILPALLTVMIASLAYGWFAMLPKGLGEFAGASLSALGFGSNIWFWMEDSYTAEPSLYKPMLHTWTLAVEEQFYIVFPIILLAVVTWAKRYILGIMLLGFFVSLEAAELLSGTYKDATFYLLHTRFWELLAGAILAQIQIERDRECHPLLRVMMPPLGLFMILHALITFDDTMRHPSFMTALPVIGTMILIWFCRRGEVVSNILSSREFVWIGLISYSLYLWHYPILAFARIDMGTLDVQTKWLCIGLAFVLAIASYFLIERPMRYKMPLKAFIAVIVVVVTGLVSMNVFILKTEGAKFRLAEFNDLMGGEMVGEWRECFTTPFPPLGEHCKTMVPNAKGTLIGMGDSHLAVLGPALRRLAQKHNLNYEQFPRCVLIEGTETIGSDNVTTPNTCPEEQIAALANYENAIIVKATRMTFRIEGINMDSPELPGREMSILYILNEEMDRKTTISRAITQTDENILATGHPLIQVYPVPEIGFVADYKLKQLMKGYEFDFENRLAEIVRSKDMTVNYTAFMDWQERVINAYDAVEHPNYYTVKPHEIFCEPEYDVCRTILNNRVLYRDTNHVSDYGAQLIIDQVEKVIEGL